MLFPESNVAPTETNESCPLRCSGCPLPEAESGGSGGDESAGAGRSGGLSGGRLVLAAGYVFGVPLAVMIAAEVVLGRRLGELGALGVGVAVSAVLLVPAWWLLRRRPRRPDVDPSAPANRGQEASS